MSSRLSRFGRALDAVIGLRAVRAEWQDRLGREWPWARALLRPTGELAAVYPNLGPDAELNEPYNVVCHDDEQDDYVGVCPDGPGRIPLTRADLLLYEPDLHQLAQRLAVALELTFDYAALSEPVRTWRVGAYQPQGGIEVCVFFAVPSDATHLLLAVAALNQCDEQPWLILTPTRSTWRSFRAARRGAVVSLDEVLDVDRSGRLTPKPAARALLNRTAGRGDGTASAAYSFRRTGATWVMSFEGDTRSVRDSKGCHYIALLLARPGQRFHVAELLELTQGPRGLAKISGGRGQETLDPRAWVQLRRRKEELTDELDEARRFGDRAAQARLQGELDELVSQVRAAQGLGQRERTIGSTVERNRKAVCNAIERALRAIRNEHRPLGRHLGDSIRLGGIVTYEPPSPVVWEL